MTIKEEINEIEDIGKQEFKNYKSFAFKGKMVEMAVSFILGAYFQKAVEAISNYLIMPIIQYALVSSGGSWKTLIWTPFFGLTFEIGKLIGVFFDFFLTSIILYIIYKKIILRFFDSEDTTKQCSSCFCQIDKRATRCNFCTSWIK